MLYKQLEKQTGDPGRFRRTAGDHGQHMGSQKSTGEGVSGVFHSFLSKWRPDRSCCGVGCCTTWRN